ncbi:MAG: PQQ-binding-like beta-propeller repeat protein, partial [Chloroflexota bacterium]|nr:PQQ-binding-like beta-propeller repeat protein [Chloroflexota bacterium]
MSVYVPRSPAHAASGDWPMFLSNNERTGYNSAETTINTTTVKNLQLKRTFSTGSQITAQPIEANGQVYWGSWDGNEYAADTAGNKLWTASIGGQTPNCSHSQTFGVASTPAVTDVTINGKKTTVVFIGGKDTKQNVASLYALNAATGAVIWETPLSSSTGSFSWASPAVYNGSVYMGLSSYDDCPLVRGALIQLDAVTGTIQNTFYVVPNGCLGGSIWSSPTIDEANGTLYITTGNNGMCSTTETSVQAIIKLNVSNLSFIDSWQVPASQHGVDSDFGATPTLFTATYGGSSHDMVGAVNKNGTYYAFDRTSL